MASFVWFIERHYDANIDEFTFSMIAFDNFLFAMFATLVIFNWCNYERSKQK